MKAKVHYFLLCFCISIFLLPSMQAQESLYLFKDKVKLRNGSVYAGEIVRIDDNGVSLLLKSGQTAIIQHTSIYKVLQYSDAQTGFSSSDEHFLESNKKMYLGLDVGMGFGQRLQFSNDISMSADFAIILQRRIALRHFVGIRANFRQVIDDFANPRVVDMLFNYEYILNTNGKITPIIGLRFGPSTVFSENNNLVKNNGITLGGGVFIGYFKSIGSNAAFRSELGYSLHGYSYSLEDWNWWGPGTRTRDVLFGTVNLRLGYIF
jgi:hypothetical protein